MIITKTGANYFTANENELVSDVCMAKNPLYFL